ncbi:unnamed protein product [Alopecurus aequalis]
MDKLRSRCLTFAEVVVIMLCPLLLALPVVPRAMVVTAGVALVISICPSLACCISDWYPACVRWPSVTRGVAATITCACLFGLACWISLVLVSGEIIFYLAFLFGLCLLGRLISYWIPEDDEPEPTPEDETANKELSTTVDTSHEFLAGVTGILYLGMEGMALEVSPFIGNKHPLGQHMIISLLICGFCVSLMFFQMIPPRTATGMNILLFLTDLVMLIVTGTLLAAIMVNLMGPVGLLFGFPSGLIFFILVLRVKKNASNGDLPTISGHVGVADNQSGLKQGDEPKPAPMGLTKVTFTGFLVVSVKASSVGSPGLLTCSFLMFAAIAIALGVYWRVLTHAHNKRFVGGNVADKSANEASFCMHFSVAVATVLAALMAWEAAKEGGSAACAHVSEVMCVHLHKILDVHNIKNMCTCISG